MSELEQDINLGQEKPLKVEWSQVTITEKGDQVWDITVPGSDNSSGIARSILVGLQEACGVDIEEAYRNVAQQGAGRDGRFLGQIRFSAYNNDDDSVDDFSPGRVISVVEVRNLDGTNKELEERISEGIKLLADKIASARTASER